ncbi:expressed protein, partial [Baffinella frigidus]
MAHAFAADAVVQPDPSTVKSVDDPPPAPAAPPGRHDAVDGSRTASPAMGSQAASPPEGEKKKKKKVAVGNKLNRQKEEVNQAINRMGMVPSEELGEVYDSMSHTYLMVRGAAAGDLGKAVLAGSNEALARLMEQMVDTSADFMRETSSGIVGGLAIDRDDVCEMVTALLSSEDAKVRESALSALQIRLHSPRVLNALHDAQQGKILEFSREKDVILQVPASDPDITKTPPGRRPAAPCAHFTQLRTRASAGSSVRRYLGAMVFTWRWNFSLVCSTDAHATQERHPCA